MSAHCDDCGFDLPYESDCTVCALQARAERAEEALKRVHAKAAAQRIRATLEPAPSPAPTEQEDVAG